MVMKRLAIVKLSISKHIRVTYSLLLHILKSSSQLLQPLENSMTYMTYSSGNRPSTKLSCSLAWSTIRPSVRVYIQPRVGPIYTSTLPSIEAWSLAPFSQRTQIQLITVIHQELMKHATGVITSRSLRNSFYLQASHVHIMWPLIVDG